MDVDIRREKCAFYLIINDITKREKVRMAKVQVPDKNVKDKRHGFVIRPSRWDTFFETDTD